MYVDLYHYNINTLNVNIIIIWLHKFEFYLQFDANHLCDKIFSQSFEKQSPHYSRFSNQSLINAAFINKHYMFNKNRTSQIWAMLLYV